MGQDLKEFSLSADQYDPDPDSSSFTNPSFQGNWGGPTQEFRVCVLEQSTWVQTQITSHICYETSQAGCVTCLALVLLGKAETREVSTSKAYFGGTKLDTCKLFATLSGSSISNQWNWLLSFFLYKLKITGNVSSLLLLCFVKHGTLWISDTSI